MKWYHMYMIHPGLDRFGPDIEYIKGKKKIAADALSQLLNNGNQETTHEQTYTTENMSEL